MDMTSKSDESFGKDSPHQSQGKPSDSKTSAVPQPARMLHYNGYARLSVDSPRTASDQAVGIATQAEGFVEQLNATSVTLRVPVQKFTEVYQALLKLGDVLEKSVTAEDVTEAFGAIGLRLQTAKTSRDRLIDLLAKAKNEREKLDLLREISRLNLEIERLEGASRTLLSLANYSRISLVFTERRHGDFSASEEPVAAFSWIHQLSPFRRDVAQEGKKLKMEAPAGLVLLDETNHWIAESADGCVYWSSVRDNSPKGDATFWRAAIKARLGAEFAKAEELELGGFLVLRLVDRGDDGGEDAYRYLVGVHAEGDKLQIVEAYFPNGTHEKRFGEAIKASISKGAQ